MQRYHALKANKQTNLLENLIALTHAHIEDPKFVALWSKRRTVGTDAY